jgi:hypothetical protein
VSAPKWRIDLVLNHYYGTSFLPSPGWRRIRCPEHEDRNASAQINTDKSCWGCFACDIAEDAIELIKRVENVREFAAAVNKYAEITGDSGDKVRRGGRASRPVSDSPGSDQLVLGARTSRRRH